jgi:hypothetical protein
VADGARAATQAKPSGTPAASKDNHRSRRFKALQARACGLRRASHRVGKQKTAGRRWREAGRGVVSRGARTPSGRAGA